MPACTLHLLGPFVARANGREVTLRRQTRALLAFLSLADQPHSRQSLCDLLFAEANDPLGALRWHLSQLRQQLGAHAIRSVGERVQLDPQMVWVDVHEFRHLLAHRWADLPLAALQAAVELYRGQLLQALALPDAPEFELWLLGQRADYQQRYATALHELVHRLIQNSQWEEALPYAQTLVRSDPLIEEAHARLIWLYAATGQREAALAQFEQCRTILRQELAVAPTPELLTLHQDIVQGRLNIGARKPAERPSITQAPTTPKTLVGRSVEMAHLQQLWQQASSGRGQVLLVEAEAGGGKTHLVRTFCTATSGLLALVGRCYESTQALPYSPWIELLGECLTVLQPADVQRLSNATLRQLVHLAPELVERLGEQPAWWAQPSEVNQDHLAAAVAELLHKAVRRPLLLFLDDLQWADEATLQLFQRMAQRAPRLPILLVGALRSEEIDDHQALRTLLRDLQRSNVTRLKLATLSLEEIAQLVEQLWPELPMGYRTHVCRKLLDSTGGNPFFVSEVVRELHHAGDLPAVLPIPDSVRSLIRGRMERLPSGAGQVLEALAVLDSPMPLGILRQTSARSEEETVSALEIGLRWGVLAAQQGDGANLYNFSHDLVRSVVADQLSAVRRQVLHRRAAETLELNQASAARLTYHWALAGNHEQERRYAMLAGEQAVDQSANRAAISYLTRALELTPVTAQTERYRIFVAREKALSSQSELEQQEADLTALHDLAESLNDNEKRSTVAVRASDYWLTRGKSPEAALLAEKAVTLALAVGDKTLEAHGRTQWSLVLWQQGKFLAAEEQARQAYRLLQAEGLETKEPRTLVMLGNIAWGLTNFDQAIAYYEKGLFVCRKVGDRASEGHALNNLGIIAIERGDYRSATYYYEQALHLYQENGSRQAQARLLANLAELYLDQGAYERADELIVEGISLAQEIGAWRDVYRQRARQSLIRHYLGHHQEAQTLLRQVMSQAEEANDDYTLADVWVKLGHMHIDTGEGAVAAAAYQQALTLQRQVGSPKQAMECLAGLASSLLHEEEPEQALEQVETILTFLQTNTLDGALEPFRVYWSCYLALQANHDSRARQVLQQAYTLLQKRAATIAAPELKRSFLENVPTNRNIVGAVHRQANFDR
jgi:DNA-binding SARP family transcriptional activator/tetratricopeptide (TPR) repeat protein